jgi:ketosteroid isomerase-like protein
VAAPTSDPEEQIRDLIEDWSKGLEARDVDRRTRHYADDVVIFDVINPTQHVGREALEQRLAEWLSTFKGTIDCEILELRVSADERIGFCYSLQRFQGDLTDGGKLDMLVRYTTCFRNTVNGWTVTHEHASTPFDPATGLAVITPHDGSSP